MCQNILKEVQRSFNLLDLKNGWDNKSAKPINKETFINASIFFLKIVSELKKDTTKLEINPCKNGTIDFSIKETAFNLLINVGNDMASWFGKNTKGKDIIKTINHSISWTPSGLIEWINKY